jgi:hypothetical protein
LQIGIRADSWSGRLFKSRRAWEAVIEDWDGKISKEGIQEPVQLASQALLKHANELETTP